MRAGLLAFALAMVVAACGTSETSSDGSPTVEITSIELDGPTASIGFDVAAEGELPTVQVNWGDHTLSPEIRGVGSLDETHTCGDDVAVSLVHESDGADGNSAGVDMSLKGRIAGGEVGSGASTPYSIGADDRLVLQSASERLGFGSSFTVADDLEIVWTINCRAHGADSFFLPFSVSTCDALDGSNGVSLTSARITIKAPTS
jgi:hypothetical protein